MGIGRSDPPPRRWPAPPGSYLIPAAQVLSAYSAAVLSGSEPAAAPRPAATVVLVKDGRAGPEALLVKRPARSGFAADAWVFPGGVVDPGDRLLDGVDPTAVLEWSRRLGLDPPDAWAYVTAALREAWEEAGILLGACSAAAAEVGSAREMLLAGELPFSDAARSIGYRPDIHNLVYLAHWITPETEPRRYDTRFFLCAVPETQSHALVGDELAEAKWLTPREAAARRERGEMAMLPPTAHTLDRLVAYASTGEMVDALRDAAVPSYLPTMQPHPDGVLVTVREIQHRRDRDLRSEKH